MDEDEDRGGARGLPMGSTPRLKETGGAADDGHDAIGAAVQIDEGEE